MDTVFMGVGALVVIGYVINAVAKAIRDSGLSGVKFEVQFKENEKPPKQLNH